MCVLTLQDLIEAAGGRLAVDGSRTPPAKTPLGRIVVDCRAIKPGDVFWTGLHADQGRTELVAQAFALGAAGVVAQQSVEPWPDRWSIRVHDVRWALWQLAAEARRRFQGRVIAVTGNPGQNTAHQMIHSVLARTLRGTTHSCHDQSQIRVPLNILAWEPNQDYAVLALEIGRSGKLDALAALCEPHIGVVTGIGSGMPDESDNPHAAARSVAELLAALPADGWAVLNSEDPWTSRMTDRCQARILRVGQSPASRIVVTEVHSRQGTLAFRIDGHLFQVPGRDLEDLAALLAAVAVGRILGQSTATIAHALRQLGDGLTPEPRHIQHDTAKTSNSARRTTHAA